MINCEKTTFFFGFAWPHLSNIFSVVDIHPVNKELQQIQVFFLHKISIIEHLWHSSKVPTAWHSMKIKQSGKCDSIRSPHQKRWGLSCQWPTNFPLIFHVLWMLYWISHFHSAEETLSFRETLIKVVHLCCTPDAGWMGPTLPSVMGGGLAALSVTLNHVYYSLTGMQWWWAAVMEPHKCFCSREFAFAVLIAPWVNECPQ